MGMSKLRRIPGLLQHWVKAEVSGWRRRSLALASLVVKRQLMLAAAALRSASWMAMFFCRASSPGLRPGGQARVSTLNSISAIPQASSGWDSANSRAWVCGGDPAAGRCTWPMGQESSRKARPSRACSGCPRPSGSQGCRDRLIHQHWHLLGRVPHGALLGCGRMAPATAGPAVRNRWRRCVGIGLAGLLPHQGMLPKFQPLFPAAAKTNSASSLGSCAGSSDAAQTSLLAMTPRQSFTPRCSFRG